MNGPISTDCWLSCLDDFRFATNGVRISLLLVESRQNINKRWIEEIMSLLVVLVQHPWVDWKMFIGGLKIYSSSFKWIWEYYQSMINALTQPVASNTIIKCADNCMLTGIVEKMRSLSLELEIPQRRMRWEKKHLGLRIYPYMLLKE